MGKQTRQVGWGLARTLGAIPLVAASVALVAVLGLCGGRQAVNNAPRALARSPR